MDAQLNFRDQLIGAGLLIPTGVDGLYGRSATFERIADAIQGIVTRLSADDGTETVHFTPAMPRADLERSGYLKSFPNLLGTVHCFCGDDRGHREILRCVAAGEDWTKDQAASEVLLIPAACYPVYPMMADRGPLPKGGATIDIVSWVFRHEPSLQPTRMQYFRQRENVRLGSAAEVDAFRELWITRATQTMKALELPHEVEVANDPFFGRTGKIVADAQRSQQLKFEMLVPVNPGAEPTACISFNYHLDSFGAAFGITTAEGATAHTGCVGWGLERLTLALVRHHGPDPRDWPPGVRATLWP